MSARVIAPILLAAITAIAFLWLAPLDMILGVRGYSTQDVQAMKAATQPQPDVPCEQGASNTPGQQTSSRDESDSYAGDLDTDDAPAVVAKAQDEAVEPAPPPARKIIATATVNVRAGQGTNYQVVGQFKPQEVVTVVEDPEGDWLKVQGDSVTGWVYRPLFDRR